MTQARKRRTLSQIGLDDKENGTGRKPNWEDFNGLPSFMRKKRKRDENGKVQVYQ